MDSIFADDARQPRPSRDHVGPLVGIGDVRVAWDAIGGLERAIAANGGDRKSAEDVPETALCERYGIEMRFGVGGAEKLNSSSNINRLRGEE